MKKRWIATGLAVAGVLTLTCVAFATSNGYEAYKDALKNMHTVKSAQAQVVFKMSDNGKDIMSGNGVVKGDHDAQKASGQMAFETAVGDKVFEFYHDKTSATMHEKGSDVWKTGTASCDQSDRHMDMTKDPEQAKNMERFIDLMLTGVKDQVQMDADVNGGSIVKLDINEGNVPEIFNIMTSMKGSRGHGNQHKMNGCPEMKELSALAPELVSDVQLKELHLEAHLTADHMITEQKVDVTLSGKAADGTQHTRHIQATIDVSGINATTPDSVNLDGKKVEPMTCER